MNSKERVFASVTFQKVDRLPTSLHNFQVCAHDSGLPFCDFFKDSEAMAQAQYNQWVKFRQDILMVENGTTALAEALGCKAEYRQSAPPAVTSHPYPDLSRPLTIPQNLFDCPSLAVNLRTTKRLCQLVGSQAVVMGRGDQGPVSLLSLLTGIDTLLIEMIDGNEENVHARLEQCTEFIIQYCLLQLKQGALITSIGDSTSGPDLISPELYRKYALPYHRKIANAVHRAGGLFSLHICGNATAILPDMLESGADILEIDEKTDLKTAVNLSRGKAALWGQISPLLMKNGSSDQVLKSVTETLNTVSDRTGFILSSGCALAPDTPESNMRIIIKSQDTLS